MDLDGRHDLIMGISDFGITGVLGRIKPATARQTARLRLQMRCRQNSARQLLLPIQPRLRSRLPATRRSGSSDWNFGWMALSARRR